MIKFITATIAATVVASAAAMLHDGEPPAREAAVSRQSSPVRFTPRKAAETSEGFFTPRKGVSSGFRTSPLSLQIPSAAQKEVARKAAASRVKLRGAMTDNSLWYTLEGEKPYGIYELSTTGSPTLIGSSGCATAWTTSGAIDSSTRTFYFVSCLDTESILYGISLDTARATRIAEIPDNMELQGLYFPEASALPKAPAKAEDMSFDFPGGALSGNFTFPVEYFTVQGLRVANPVKGQMVIVRQGGKAFKAVFR